MSKRQLKERENLTNDGTWTFLTSPQVLRHEGEINSSNPSPILYELRCRDRRRRAATSATSGERQLLLANVPAGEGHYGAGDPTMAPSAEAAEEIPFLSNENSSLVGVEGEQGVRKEPVAAKLSRWALRVIAWSAVVFFVALHVVQSTEVGHEWFESYVEAARVGLPYHSKHGAFLILWGGPVFLIVFCGVVYLHFFPRSSRRPVKRKAPRASLGAHPIIVSGPFGVMSAAELLCMVVFILVLAWWLYWAVTRALEGVRVQYPPESGETLWTHYLSKAGIRLGFLGQICLGLLFLPVARGSVLLRLVDIPFEHAAKYHVWLGHFTMTIFSLHGLSFIPLWIAKQHLIAKLLAWKTQGISNFPGVIALLAGLCMWMTSFQYTRVHAFELFFYTHQLYIVFIISMALHVGDSFFGICFAGIFLFTFDRFLRFCQSKKEVLALSAKVLPCGTFEVVLPKPSDLKYNALSFIFLNIPALGRLQWHPFSVSSSPKDSPHSIKFLIKPLGTWTRQLNDTIRKAAASQCPLRLKAAVEGPYGHETSYFLDYEALLLVAGGIGVSPLVAIIRDILRRYQQNEPHLPKDVTLIWAVKHSEELAVLDSLSPGSIYPEYTSKLNLTLKVYVTKEADRDVEKSLSQADLVAHTQSAQPNPDAAQKSISHLVGSGDILWVGAALAASLVGYLLATGLVGKFYYLPVDNNDYKTVHWYVRGGLVVLSLLFGVWVFGGSVILLWHLVSSRRTKRLSAADEPLLRNSREDEIPFEKLVQPSNTVYGCRPDLQGVFEGCAKRLGGSNVGVLVCGPEGMQSSVATQCRAFNSSFYGHHKVAFSYHSVSFDL